MWRLWRAIPYGVLTVTAKGLMADYGDWFFNKPLASKTA